MSQNEKKLLKITLGKKYSLGFAYVSWKQDQARVRVCQWLSSEFQGSFFPYVDLQIGTDS